MTVGRNLSTRGWNAVSIRVDEAGVHVAHGGVTYLRNVALPFWRPQPDWTFGIGAELHSLNGVSAKDNAVLVDNWKLRSAYLHPRHQASLRVSFNGQQYTEPLMFEYYRPPVLSEVSPTSGPIFGATMVRLHGEALSTGSNRRFCRFANRLVVEADLSTLPCLVPTPREHQTAFEQLWQPPHSSLECGYMLCRAPPVNLSNGLVEVSLNGQQYHASRPSFRYTTPATLSSIAPRGGPIAGATLISLLGYSFARGASNYTCRFEELTGDLYALTLATLDAELSSVLRCHSPWIQTARVLTMRISLNAQQYIGMPENLTFTFYKPPRNTSFFPAGGAVVGGTVVTLFGSGLNAHSKADGLGLFCKFGQHIVAASNATCVAPPGHQAGVSLEMTDDAVALHGSARSDGDVTRLVDNPMRESVSGIPGPSGYAVLPQSRPIHEHPHFQGQTAFAARFKLLIDHSGQGVSFSYGEVACPIAALGEFGGGAGLRVLFLTGDAATKRRAVLAVTAREDLVHLPPSPEQLAAPAAERPGLIQVVFAGESLGSCELQARAATSPHGVWRNVHIEYRDPTIPNMDLRYYRRRRCRCRWCRCQCRYASDVPRQGLYVALDGAECFPPTPLPQRARREWRFGVGARATAVASRHWIRKLHIELGTRTQNAHAPLLLSSNLQQWTAATSTPAQYVYHHVPRVSTFAPRTGPTAGGTTLRVYGWRLHGTNQLCRFAVKLDTSLGAGGLEDSLVSPATFVPYDGSLRCTTPAVNALPVALAAAVTASSALHLRISLNGQQYGVDAHAFRYFDKSAHVSAVGHLDRLLPASGPTGGGTLIQVPITGVNGTQATAIRQDNSAACLFDGSSVTATVAQDGMSIACVTPPSEVASDALLQMTLNGQQLLATTDDPLDTSIAYGGSSPHFFHYYAPSSVTLLEPAQGPYLRGASVSIRLYPPVPLAAATGVTCSFGDTVTLGALLPGRMPLHTAASLVYAPRSVAYVGDHHAELGPHADGAHLLERFAARGLPSASLLGIQYDADPIDAQGNSITCCMRGAPSRYTEGRKFGLSEYEQRWAHDLSAGRAEWLAASTVLQWYHNGRGTCVGYGHPNDFCNASQLVCAGPNEEYGNYDEQASAAVTAILAAGGVHPDCPSLFSFNSDAYAWLHYGAGDWQHSTLVDRGSMAHSTPSDAKDAWRAYISNEQASILNCTVPVSEGGA